MCSLKWAAVDLFWLSTTLGENKGDHWTQNGADVMHYLASDVMQRLESDPGLCGEGCGLNTLG